MNEETITQIDFPTWLDEYPKKFTSETLSALNRCQITFPARDDALFDKGLTQLTRSALSKNIQILTDDTDEIRVLLFADIRLHFGVDNDATCLAINRFAWACFTQSDIQRHMNVLFRLACRADHVTELGTRTGVSTAAFVAARPKTLCCYDLSREPEVDQIEASSGPIDFQFFQEDTLTCTIEPTDVMLVDTLHTYDQVKQELQRHAQYVRQYIVFHDTVIYGIQGIGDPDDAGHIQITRGLRPAIYEFLHNHQEWYMVDERLFCNGLAIIGRR